jgi:hypothetical protein
MWKTEMWLKAKQKGQKFQKENKVAKYRDLEDELFILFCCALTVFQFDILLWC